jgi:hypothetical protein
MEPLNTNRRAKMLFERDPVFRYVGDTILCLTTLANGMRDRLGFVGIVKGETKDEKND